VSVGKVEGSSIENHNYFTNNPDGLACERPCVSLLVRFSFFLLNTRPHQYVAGSIRINVMIVRPSHRIHLTDHPSFFSGRKTVGNDLDNARLTFTHFRTPLSSLLSRYLTVDAAGKVGFSLFVFLISNV
jgi:hypothetical protein